MINFYNSIILTKIIAVSLEIKELTAVLFIILIKRARKSQKPLTVFKVLLKDYTKILYPKVIRTLTEIQKLLPA